MAYVGRMLWTELAVHAAFLAEIITSGVIGPASQ
jgi:hypothetical protein